MTATDDELKAQMIKAQLRMAREKAAQGGLAPGVAGAIAQAKAGTLQLSPERAAQQAALDKPVAQQIRDPGALQAAATGAFQGLTLGWGDEAIARLYSAMNPQTSPELAQKLAQQEVDAAQFSRPVTTGVAGVAGNIAAAAPALALSPAWATGGTALAGKLLAGGVWGGAAGSAQGAGEANEGEKRMGAGIGAGLGFAAGAIAPLASAAITRYGTKPVRDYMKRTDLIGIKKALGISTDAAKIIKGFLANDDLASAQAALAKAGPEGMLADSSPQASQLLDTSIAAGGPSMSIARDAVEARSAAAADGLKAKMDAVLGPAQGVKASARDISASTASARESAFDASYAALINYSAPEGRAIEAVLGRIPNKTLSAAIQEANDAMRAAGIKNKQIMATIAPDGSVTLTEMPNVQQLDFIKRALGAVADGAKDNFGRYTGEGVRTNGLARDLRDAIGRAVPQYRTAVRLGGDKIAEDKALEIGRKFMQPGLTREDVAIAMKGASAEARQAAKRGMRAAFDEAMANVKAVASDQNIDARQALTAVKDFSSEANRAKAELILGKGSAQALFAEFDKAATQLVLRTAVSKGSLTAARTQGMATVEAMIDEGVINRIRHMEPVQATKEIGQIMMKSTASDDREYLQKVWGEIARALTEAKGVRAQSALQIVHRAMQGAPASERQAKFVAQAITALAGVRAYQSGERALSTLLSDRPRQPN